MKKPDYRKCLVLDSGYMPRQIITSERAFVVSLKGNANIIHNHPEKFGLVNPDLEIYRPSVIVVPKYINTHFYKLPPTRDNIFKRDDYTCVYCGYNDMRAVGYMFVGNCIASVHRYIIITVDIQYVRKVSSAVAYGL